VIKKSRFVLALGLVIALAASAFAFADGVSDNTADVDGDMKKTKNLPKKKADAKPNEMFTGVRTETTDPIGTQSNPAREVINFGKNVIFDLKAGSECSTLPGPGSSTQQARDACPEDSYLGGGEAELVTATGRISDVVVSVFKGPAQNGIQLHTSSPTLGSAAPTVPGSIEKSTAGSKYGQALVVPAAPETGGLMITKFNATIEKSSKSVLTYCKAKSFLWQRQVTYKDGSSETAEVSEACTAKKPKNN
jgi:hypothetical protein